MLYTICMTYIEKCLLTLKVLQVTSQCGHNSLINGSPLESNKLLSLFRGCMENRLRINKILIHQKYLMINL